MSSSQPVADTPPKPSWRTHADRARGLWRNIPLWRKALVLVAGAFVVGYLAWRGPVKAVMGDENQPAGQKIVAALEAHKRATGKFPQKLEELQPKFLPALPRPAADTNFVYAATPDGSGAWFGYQTGRDTLAEYDTRSRRWDDVEYEDSFVLRQRTKEFVKGPSS